jgi:uncharacterized membrane protein SpoIIM required for sporulation
MHIWWVLRSLALVFYVGGVIGCFVKYREYGIKGPMLLTCVAAPFGILVLVGLFIRCAVGLRCEDSRIRPIRLVPSIVLAFRSIPVFAGLIAVGVREVVAEIAFCSDGVVRQNANRSILRRGLQMSHAAVRVLQRECLANCFGDS